MHKTIKGKNTPKNWILSPKGSEGGKKWYSADEVIDAYLKGMIDQKNENERLLNERFGENLERAKKLGEQMFIDLMVSKIKCFGIRLRPVDIVTFDFLFFVSETDFISDSFVDVYTKFFKRKKVVSDNNFKVFFSFMPTSEYLNLETLLSDGYILGYGEKK